MLAQFADVIARQHQAELQAELSAIAARRGQRGDGRTSHRPSPRIRLGRLLVRWGQRLAPPPSVAPGPRRAATMGT